MSTDAFAVLARLREFLIKDLLPAVPQSLRSELRSAAKLLEDCEREFDALPFRLATEANRLLDLCDRAGAASGENEDEVRERSGRIRRRLADIHRTHDLMDLHRDARELSTVVLSALLQKQEQQTACDEVIDATVRTFLHELRDQSAVRQSWQSVFVSSDSNEDPKKNSRNQGLVGTL